MAQQPAQQPYYPAPGAPPVRYGPPVGVRIGQSPVAKLGIVVMIIAILGLILALAVPWVTVEQETGSGDKETFSFNYDMDLVDGDEDNWYAGDKLTNDDETEDYFKGSVGLAFIGFILVIILAIILIVIVVMSYASNYPRGVFHGLNAIMGAVLLIPGIMIIISGMNFLGFELAELHANIMSDELGYDVTSSWIYPAAYLVLIFGFIILLISFIILNKELKSTFPSQPTQPAIQPQRPQSPQYPGGGY
jgi:MFS family permease